jgi:hypothetical protein
MKGTGVVRRVLSIAMLAGTIGCGAEPGTGPANEADTVAVSSELLFPTCWGEIPTCSACEFVTSSSAARGKFTCLVSKYKRAEVVTNLSTTNMSPAPVVNTDFNQSVPAGTPTTAYIQLKYQDASGFWQNGHTVTLPIH